MIIQPYSHQEALVQFPVQYELGDGLITLYPLTLGAVIDLNRALRSEFLSQLEDKGLSGQESIDYHSNLLKIVDGMNFETGKGREFFFSSTKLLIPFVRHLCRFNEEWSESRLSRILFPFGAVEEDGLVKIIEMKTAVTRQLPEPPSLNIRHKEPRYKATQEETEARIYKSFAEKFGWNWEQIQKLTEYQVFWYSYLFPEEREHIEEMDEMANKDNPPGTLPIPNNPNVKQITDPEEIRQWMMENMNKKQS